MKDMLENEWKGIIKMARKYIDYLKEQIYYWKKKAKESTGSIVGHAEYMYESFREKLEKYKNKQRSNK